MTWQDSAHSLLLGYLCFTGWMALGVASGRASRLRREFRPWANLLCLVAGPAGWIFHLGSRWPGWGQEDPDTPADDGLPKTGRYALRADPAAAAAATPEVPAGMSGAASDSGDAAGAIAAAVLLAPAPVPKWRRLFSRRPKEEGPDGITVANAVLTAALASGASDIHIEPLAGGYVVRFRVFGLLREHAHHDAEAGERLVSVFMVMASLNTADRTKMQDGRIRWADPATQHELDVRISVSPAHAGLKAAMRLLNRPASLLRLTTIGLPERLHGDLMRALRQPEGLVLVAGPTGSGKTSSAYALLQEVSGPSVNTMTIEDPVEYSLPYATQIAINPKQGITFESGLRTLLRQDPNVIFVGEMRDAESFKIGIRAAMSGHLVVSTMHARDPIAAITALRNLNLDRQALSSALRLMISQRLVRELCPHCRTLAPADRDAREFLGGEIDGGQLPAPGPGCPQCQQGFTGRTGVFEVLRVDAAVRRWITSEQPEAALRTELAASGHTTMRDDAREKVLSGRVWIDDAIRALGVDAE